MNCITGIKRFFKRCCRKIKSNKINKEIEVDDKIEQKNDNSPNSDNS